MLRAGPIPGPEGECVNGTCLLVAPWSADSQFNFCGTARDAKTHTHTHTHTHNGQQVLKYPEAVQLPFLCVAHLSVSTSAISFQRPYSVTIALLTFRLQRLISATVPSFQSPLAQRRSHSPCPKVPLALFVYSRLLPCNVRPLTKQQFTILIHTYMQPL